MRQGKRIAAGAFLALLLLLAGATAENGVRALLQGKSETEVAAYYREAREILTQEYGYTPFGRTGELLSPAEAAQRQYVGNKRTKKFHAASCDAVLSMKEERMVFFASPESAREAGYTPCGGCCPEETPAP